MKTIRTALIAAACSAGLVTSYAAFAQQKDASSPGSPTQHNVADHAANDHADKAKTSDKDIVEVATGPGMTNVTTLVAALKAADLVDTLKGDGPFTVFAPTNEAFKKLPAGTVEDLLKPENKDKLRALLLNHVHKGDAVKSSDLKAMEVTTVGGTPIKIEKMNDHWMAGNAKISKADVMAKNGIIHQVDSVIMPGTDKSHADHKH